MEENNLVVEFVGGPLDGLLRLAGNPYFYAFIPERAEFFDGLDNYEWNQEKQKFYYVGSLASSGGT